ARAAGADPLPRRDAARPAAERLRVVADGADHADLGVRGLRLRGPVPDPVGCGVQAPAPDHPRLRNVPEDGRQGRRERLTGPAAPGPAAPERAPAHNPGQGRSALPRDLSPSLT